VKQKEGGPRRHRTGRSLSGVVRIRMGSGIDGCSLRSRLCATSWCFWDSNTRQPPWSICRKDERGDAMRVEPEQVGKGAAVYVRFWGTRGSIATPGRQTAKYGGNTACVEVQAADGTVIVFDCGTGARELGLHLWRCASRPLRLHLFIGHTHWDHIQGFPFFKPAFLPTTELHIYAPRGFQCSLEETLAGALRDPYFPMKLRDLRSHLHFTELEEGFFEVGSVRVETQYLNHTAPTLAYRISSRGTTVAYVTDHEPFWKPEGLTFHHPGDRRHIAFLKGVDLLIHDAQYTAAEYPSRVGWGHSTIEYAIDVALDAGAGQLALFHHDPSHDDATLRRLEAAARARVATHGASLKVFAAAEGRALEVHGRGGAPAIAVPSALRHRPIVGGRVLVIGAEKEIAAIGQALEEDDLTLISASDRSTALMQVSETAPDLVIVDQDLPDGDGAALIQLLRCRLGRRTLPILLLTARPDIRGALRRSGTAATDYLAKPFLPPMLRTRVQAWLARTLLGYCTRPWRPPLRSQLRCGAA
jgi:phosphoribosyl 1,2-cyclic phosphodiesterase